MTSVYCCMEHFSVWYCKYFNVNLLYVVVSKAIKIYVHVLFLESTGIFAFFVSSKYSVKDSCSNATGKLFLRSIYNWHHILYLKLYRTVLICIRLYHTVQLPTLDIRFRFVFQFDSRFSWKQEKK